MTTRQFSTCLCAGALALVSLAGCKDANHSKSSYNADAKASSATSAAAPASTGASTGSGGNSGTTGATALTDTEGNKTTGQNASSVKAPAPAPGTAGRNGNDPVDSSRKAQ